MGQNIKMKTLLKIVVNLLSLILRSHASLGSIKNLLKELWYQNFYRHWIKRNLKIIFNLYSSQYHYNRLPYTGYKHE